MSEFPLPSDSDGVPVIVGPKGSVDILTVLPKVRHKIGFVGKTQQRTVGARYQFRGIDDVLNYIGPVLEEYGITPVPQFFKHTHDVLNTKTADGNDRSMTVVTLGLRLYLFAVDGSGVCFIAYGEGREYGDDKSTAKAQSMAFKVAAFLGLMVPVSPDGLDDGDKEAGEPDERNAVAGRAPSATKPEDRGATRSKFFQNARTMIATAGEAKDVEKLKKYSKSVQSDDRLTAEEKAALNRAIIGELNKLAPPQAEPKKGK